MNNAYEIPNLRFSLPAGEDIPRRRFVGVNATGEGVLAATTAVAFTPIGVSMNEAAAGEVLEVADGIVVVEASNAIEAGANISVAEGGLAVTATDGEVVGTALTGAASANLFITVKIR